MTENQNTPLTLSRKDIVMGKATTKNIARIMKHSRLLKIADTLLGYDKGQVALHNDEKNSGITMEFKIDFNEKLKISRKTVFSSTNLNIGYCIFSNFITI